MRKIVRDSQRTAKKSSFLTEELLKQMPDSIIVIDLSGTIQEWLGQSEKIFGYSAKEAIGKPISFLHQLQIRKQISGEIKHATKHFDEYSREIPCIRKDGTPIVIETRGTTIFSAAGKPIGRIGINRDITKLKRQKTDEERQQFLNKLTDLLISSFDDSTLLQEIAKLLISYIADYCRIVLLDENGHIMEIQVNHKNPKKISLAQTIYDNYMNDSSISYGVGALLKTGKPERIAVINEEVLHQNRTTDQLIKAVKKIGLASYMGVPLIARGKIIGAVTLSSVKKNRFYTEDDLNFSQDIAHRIALAIDNLRLYKTTVKQRERFRSLLEHSVNAITLIDAGGKRIYVTPSRKNVLGYHEEDDIGGSVFRHVHPEDIEGLTKALKSLARTPGKSLTKLFRVQHKNTSWIWIEATGTNLLHVPSVSAIVINYHDVTEKVTAGKNLQFLADVSKVLASALDYEKTLKNVAKLAILQIADWCSIAIQEGDSLKQLVVLHKDPKKISLAKEIRKRNTPDIHEPGGISRVLQTGKSEFYPDVTEEMIRASIHDTELLKLIQKVGLRSIMIVPLLIQGRAIGVISFVSAESNKHFTQADLAMAEEVAARSALAIENARLYATSQKAVAIRDDFISIASHELKTPVTSLKMYTQILEKQFLQRNELPLVENLKKMNRQVDKLTHLIQDLLNVSKMQLGKLDFRDEAFDVGEVIRDVVENMRSTTEKHTIVIDGEVKEKVWGDKDRIEQVLINLLSNAIKYSPKGGQIIVRVTSDKNDCVISIQDFGIGIDRTHQNKIFSLFYRVDDTTEKTYPGLGIGLFIANEIIRRHGGKMYVTSKKGKGSLFRFTLPCYRQSSE